MKKYLVYMTCAAAAMIGGTGCSDFGDGVLEIVMPKNVKHEDKDVKHIEVK